jgi:putative ABC transport system substrate-binding protein
MRRRDFILGAGSGAAAWPLAVLAQQRAIPLVGFLHGGAPGTNAHIVTAFRQGLAELDYSEGQTVAVEYHWAAGRYDTLQKIAANLASRRAAAIAVGGGGTPHVVNAKVTGDTPIVFNTGTDPAESGLVASLNRPGGHVTGVHIFTSSLEGKRLGLLRDLISDLSSVGMLTNPNFSQASVGLADAQTAARALGLNIQVLRATNRAEIEAAFVTLAQQRVRALLVAADPFFYSQRDHIVALAARSSLPAIYEQREFALVGGLASYGTNLRDAYRQIGRYVGRILKGEKPGDLPVVQSVTFELVVNMKTAKALGLNPSQSLLLAADEVIE